MISTAVKNSAKAESEYKPQGITPGAGRRLRIAFVMASESHGGAAIMTFRQARGLARLGHDVRLYCAGPKASRRREQGVYIEVIDQKNPPALYHYVNPSLLFRLARRLRKFKPDILHFIAINLRTFSLAALELSHFYPAVWTLKDVWPVCMTGWPEPPDCIGMTEGCVNCPTWPKWQVRLNRVIKESVYATCPLHIAVPSQWLANMIKKSSFLGRNPITVIPNGLDPEPWRFGAFRSYEKTFDRKKPFRILYPAGRLLAGKLPAIRKGWPDLLNAMQIMTEQNLPVEILFAGDMDEAQKKQAEGLPVQWFPSCSYAKMQELYQMADAFVLPTLGDNFPATVLEAMAAGLPVVATRTGGIPEAVTHGETGFLVPPRNPSALAEHIQMLIQDDGLRKKMGCMGRRRFEERFTGSPMIRSYNSLFYNIAGSL